MDSFLVFIVLVVMSAVATWLQKKRQGTEGAEEESWPTQSLPPQPGSAPHRSAPPMSARPAPRSTTSSWEEELRRLLEGETAEAPSPPPPSPPPPPPTARPTPVSRPSPPPLAPARHPTVASRPASAPPVPMVERPQTPEARSASPARLEESAQAYFRASQVHEAAAKRFRQVTQMTTEHRVTTGSGRQVHQSAEVAAAVALLHHPRSARQAVVASLILGTPRGLE